MWSFGWVWLDDGLCGGCGFQAGVCSKQFADRPTSIQTFDVRCDDAVEVMLACVGVEKVCGKGTVERWLSEAGPVDHDVGAGGKFGMHGGDGSAVAVKERMSMREHLEDDAGMGAKIVGLVSEEERFSSGRFDLVRVSEHAPVAAPTDLNMGAVVVRS